MEHMHRGRMTRDQSSTDNLPWGSPSPTTPRWGVRETTTALGVAAVIAALGGAAIYAATGDASRSSEQAMAHAMPGGPHPGGRPDEGAPAAALHGEFVVPDDAGGYATMLTQTGAVTEVSPTSVTVRSADNYTQSYAIPPGAQADHTIAVADEIDVRAKRSGQIPTVTTVSRHLEHDGPGLPGVPPAGN